MFFPFYILLTATCPQKNLFCLPVVSSHKSPMQALMWDVCADSPQVPPRVCVLCGPSHQKAPPSIFLWNHLLFFCSNFCSQHVALETTWESRSMWERNNERSISPLGCDAVPSAVQEFLRPCVSHFQSNKSGL